MTLPEAPWRRPDLSGRVALVAGATRGAGRAIAVALADCGAFVYCTGRSVPGQPGMPGRSETIDGTVRTIEDRGGRAAAVRVDHTDPEQVRALLARVRGDHGRLDILVDSVWGGNPLTQWGRTFWEHDLDMGLRLLRQAVAAHVVTAHFAAPLLAASKGVAVQVTDGTEEDNRDYRGNLFYDLAKVGVNRLAFGMAAELAPHGAVAVAITPGFLRSEEMLEHFGVREEDWRDAVAQDPYFAESETPHYVARAVAHLVADRETWRRGGHVFSSAEVAHRYGFTDVDGRTPDFPKVLARIRHERAAAATR